MLRDIVDLTAAALEVIGLFGWAANTPSTVDSSIQPEVGGFMFPDRPAICF
jgi:hypothetical protein